MRLIFTVNEPMSIDKPILFLMHTPVIYSKMLQYNWVHILNLSNCMKILQRHVRFSESYSV